MVVTSSHTALAAAVIRLRLWMTSNPWATDPPTSGSTELALHFSEDLSALHRTCSRKWCKKDIAENMWIMREEAQNDLDLHKVRRHISYLKRIRQEPVVLQTCVWYGSLAPRRMINAALDILPCSTSCLCISQSSQNMSTHSNSRETWSLPQPPPLTIGPFASICSLGHQHRISSDRIPMAAPVASESLSASFRNCEISQLRKASTSQL